MNVLPGAPSIGRLQSNATGSFVVSGPVSSRLGLLVAGALAQSSRMERDSVATLPSRTQDSPRSSVLPPPPTMSSACSPRTTAWPFLRRAAPGSWIRHCSSTTGSPSSRAPRDHRPQAGLAWTGASPTRTAPPTPALSGVGIIGVTERLRDGVPWDLAASATAGRQRTYVSWRGDPGRVGMFGCASAAIRRECVIHRGHARSAGDTVIGELVDGHPARAFTYTAGGSSRRSAAEVAFWAMDRMCRRGSISTPPCARRRRPHRGAVPRRTSRGDRCRRASRGHGGRCPTGASRSWPATRSTVPASRSITWPSAILTPDRDGPTWTDATTIACRRANEVGAIDRGRRSVLRERTGEVITIGSAGPPHQGDPCLRSRPA